MYTSKFNRHQWDKNLGLRGGGTAGKPDESGVPKQGARERGSGRQSETLLRDNSIGIEKLTWTCRGRGHWGPSGEQWNVGMGTGAWLGSSPDRWEERCRSTKQASNELSDSGLRLRGRHSFYFLHNCIYIKCIIYLNQTLPNKMCLYRL